MYLPIFMVKILVLNSSSLVHNILKCFQHNENIPCRIFLFDHNSKVIMDMYQIIIRTYNILCVCVKFRTDLVVLRSFTPGAVTVIVRTLPKRCVDVGCVT